MSHDICIMCCQLLCGVENRTQRYYDKYLSTTPHNPPIWGAPHMRHTAAMELLQASVDTSVISLWLGHESPETTQLYLKANLALKEKALEKVPSLNGKSGRYRPDDQLLNFLNNL